MKLITSFDDALHYVHRLGFAGNGSIAQQQWQLCHTCDLLLSASGQDTWHKKEFKPFMVRLKRYKTLDGIVILQASRFLVIRNGYKRVLDIQTGKDYQYFPIVSCSGFRSPVGLPNDPWHTCAMCNYG